MDSQTILPLNILVLLLVMAATVVILLPVTRAQVLSKNDCPSRCGNLTIPYPFGMKKGCFLNKNFHINCNESADSSIAYLANTGFIVTNITMDGQLQILTPVARECYETKGDRVTDFPQNTSLSHLSIYTVSNTRNKFTAIGCDSFGYLLGFVGNKRYTTGCMAVCDRFEDLVDGSCSGFGCCQIQIPDGLKALDMRAYSFFSHANVSDFNRCTFAFVVEESRFRFSPDYVLSIPVDYKVPVSLDWVVSNETCAEAATNPSNYTCHRNECYEPGIGSGYICKCSNGFHGNPYLPGGCLDIDECKIRSPCDKNATCHNVPGSFKCNCKRGFKGDGKRKGTGCSPVNDLNIGLVVCISILVLVLCICITYWGLYRRKLARQRERFFRRNGGIMLQQEFSNLSGPVSARIFSSEELEKATNNFHEARILGQGGYGTVYKGILHDKRVVAIKKSMIADHSQVEHFINEVVVLSQVNHRHVVKLLGCCLETEVPLLVYEFISNGTLYQRLHCSGKGYLSWECRLRIAAETAEALSYLHSAASPPIIHRDVKSTNILLDENYTAKVSDFGASRLVPVDKTQLTTLVQGTLGYLDPEYFQSSQLTEKSDVYSFGVVLLELLTGRTALCFQRPEEERNLAMHFVSSLKKDRLFGIIDHRVLVEGNSTTQINEVAMLANRCLRVRGEERPSMKEVVMELEDLRAMPKQVNDDTKVTEYSVGEVSDANAQANDISPSEYGR